MSLSFDPRIRQGCVALESLLEYLFKYIEIEKLGIA